MANAEKDQIQNNLDKMTVGTEEPIKEADKDKEVIEDLQNNESTKVKKHEKKYWTLVAVRRHADFTDFSLRLGSLIV